MFPEIHFVQIQINSYPFFITFGVIGVVVYLYLKANIVQSIKRTLIFFTIVGGIYYLGIFLSGLIYRLIHGGNILMLFSIKLFILNQGLSSLGFVILVPMSIIAVKYLSKLSWLECAKYGLQSVLLGWGIGKIGCFMAGCCGGSESNCFLAVKFPAHPNIAVHPVQLYESVFLLVMFVISLTFGQKLKSQVLHVLLLTLVFPFHYFWRGFFRTFPKTSLFGLTLYQNIALVFMTLIAATICIIILKEKITVKE